MSNGVVDAVKRLADVLAEENEALKRLDYPAAMLLVPAKEAALADLAKQPKGLTLPASMAAVGERLGTLAAENQVLLERAIAVQTRIVRIVAQACVPPPAVTRYGGRGGKTPSHRAGALALSTRA